MRLLRNMSIRAKLTLFCMLTSVFALIVASVTFYVYELRSIREQFESQYVSLAKAAAPLTTAALDFLDEQSAQEVLTHLAEDPEIEAAAIYDRDGNVFAQYVRGEHDHEAVPAQPRTDGTYYQIGDLYVFEPVRSMGERAGTIALHVHPRTAQERAIAYGGLVGVVLIISVAATFIFSAMLVPWFSGPIVELARVTRRIADQRIFSVRAVRTSNDELGDLIDSFNEMLNQIERRDEKLAKHREDLEAQVAARTEEIRKFALAVHQSPATTVITDAAGEVEYVNREFTETTGYTLDEALAKAPEVLKAGRLPKEERKKLDEALKAGREWKGEFKNRRKNGTTFWEWASVAPLSAPDGRITHYIWIKEDITERKRAEEALRESEDRYALAAQGANDGLWDWDLRSDTVYYSERWKAMIGYRESEISSSPNEWFDRIDERDLPTVREKIDDHLSGHSPHFEHEYRIRHKDGSYRWMLCRGVSVVDDEGNVYRFAGSQTDITDRKQAEQKLFFEASHDHLTGLPNRGLLLERLANAVTRAKRAADFRFAVLFLDLDRFKVINDSLGHAVGDELLMEVSRRLGLCVREQDTIARLGGDEFAILLEGIDQDKDPIRVAERIQDELTRPYNLLDNEVFTSASIGIATGSAGYDSSEDILRDADAAMYRAKSLGKARFAMFDMELHDEAVRRLQLESDLRRAVQSNDFTLHFQPIIELGTDTTIGFEALARWDHPEHGFIPPSEFITIAEETGMISSLGWWILEEACSQLAEWHAAFETVAPLTMSVNVSGKQFIQKDFAEQVKHVLDRTGVRGSQLKLEITESAVIENTALVRDSLAALRKFGIELCIDDFGTGYSSLSCLHELPFDVLKIDRSFIEPIDKDAEAFGIVQAIVGLAKNLRLKVTAEGVETDGHLAHLTNLRCDAAQGYYISKPMTAEEAVRFISARGDIRAERTRVS